MLPVGIYRVKNCINVCQPKENLTNTPSTRLIEQDREEEEDKVGHSRMQRVLIASDSGKEYCMIEYGPWPHELQIGQRIRVTREIPLVHGMAPATSQDLSAE